MNKNSGDEVSAINPLVLSTKPNNQKANNNKCWNDFFSEILDKHETTDEKLKIVLQCLKARTNVPRKENKFHNYINAFSPSKNIPDCANIIWNIISSHEGFQSFKDKSNEASQISIKSSIKRKNTNDALNEEPEIKKSLMETGDENSKTGKTADSKLWDDIVVERLESFETTDENLKLVINRLKNRKHMPQRENKFANFLLTIPESRKVENCTQILWGVICKTDPTESTDKESTEFVNGGCQPQPKSQSATGKPVKPEFQSINPIEWYENAMEQLNRHHTVNIDLQAVIDRLKMRKNLPRKFNKFRNFINAMPLSKKVDNCADIIWDIVSSTPATSSVEPMTASTGCGVDGKCLSL